ncbi:MAG: ABC transporter permease [Candidatus Rokubacteria bacterium]|nr:ABC transporter permease [Candidatus Rokubacteria bacterium]MBI3107420.1 ABC transporter permease [Candidatus Rokubacteria bacterium]
MIEFLARRVLVLIPVLFLMSVIVFGVLRLIPGDPVDVMMGSDQVDAEARQALRHELGLDLSLPHQYLRWVGRVGRGDLGRSVRNRESVLALIADKLPKTLLLATASALVALAVALPLGIVAAVRRNTAADYAAMVIALLGVSVPNFWLGILLVLGFALGLGWLPSQGYASLITHPGEALQYLVLPALTLGLAMAGVVTRMVRSSVLEAIGQDYVRTARAKGLSERGVVWKHALKNALIPTVTVVGLQFGTLLGGAVVVEQVFSWPGIGWLVVHSIFARDYPVVQGVTLVVGVLFVVINTAVDVLYSALDPRVRVA